jgi:hydroxymethylpyrimidine/phosphomethylpyrimidine kinase
MTFPSPWPAALTIAGSDSGGGAGIQADLRTFAFHRVHGTSVLTCVTAQNTVGVTRVDALPPDAVMAQLDAITSDIAVQGVKTGMLLNQAIIQAVAQGLGCLPPSTLVVVDPVMVSRSGAQLIDDTAIATLTQQLIPQAAIVTPNRYEAQLLSGLAIHTLADMEAAARKIYQLGPQAVLVKGGGMADDLKGTDVWFDGHQVTVLTTAIVDTPNTHGTGCTLSAAIAANLALGLAPFEAVQQAKDYVTAALQHALSIGRGQGPVGHFFPLLTEEVGVRWRSC